MADSIWHRLAAAARALPLLAVALAVIALTAATGGAAVKAPVTVSIVTGGETLRAGSTRSVIVTVRSDDGRTLPTGTVSLRIQSAKETVHEQTLALGPATGTASTASARITYPSMAGAFGADAIYNGDAAHQTGFAHGAGMLLYASSVSVTSSRTPSRAGEHVELTFTVASQNPSAIPAGHVRVRSTKVDRLLPLSNGTATLILESLAPGSHAFSADYWPDTLHLRAGVTFRQEVEKAAPFSRRANNAVARTNPATPTGRSLFLGSPIAEGRLRGDVSPFGAYADGRTTTRLLASTSLVGSWSSPASTFAPRTAGAAPPARARELAGRFTARLAP